VPDHDHPAEPAAAGSTPTATGVRRAGLWRRRWRTAAVVGLLVAAMCGSGLLFYLNDRNAHQQWRSAGVTGKGAWLDLTVTVQRVDTADQQLVLNVLPTPGGTLLSPEDDTFTQDVSLYTASLRQTSLRLAKGSTATLQQVTLPLYDGVVTDYPFDRYDAEIAWAASGPDGPLPVVMGVQIVDPFFVIQEQGLHENPYAFSLSARFSRSRGTFILAWFMMAAMWTLSLTVLGSTVLLVRKRGGVVWPALGWMAATLFALVGLRNAAPGSPPIGSLIDYVAFFWSEAVIAGSVACVVAFGIAAERRSLPPASAS
jgi:hypothetical protein